MELWRRDSGTYIYYMARKYQDNEIFKTSHYYGYLSHTFRVDRFKQLPQQTQDGKSLGSLIRDEKKMLNRPFLAWWFPHPHEGHGRQLCQVIFQDGWKLIHDMEANETELYNLDIDQSEQNNRAPVEPERTREMLETLNQWVKGTSLN